MNILLSACLIGQKCRYDGQSKEYELVNYLLNRPDVHIIPFCPEQGGGLATPRDPAERQGDRVVTEKGKDVTAAYELGAREALRLCQLFHCTCAILKEKSPSCGSGVIYDGTFSRTLTAGDGVTTALLKENGITILGESQIARLIEVLQTDVL